MAEPNAGLLHWSVDIEVDPDAELHRIAQAYLSERPADARPVHRAVMGGVGLLLSRRLALAGRISGDREGPVKVEVRLPSGARRALSMLAAAVPSRWRWRNEGGDLVGRAPREGGDVAPTLGLVDCPVTWAFRFDETVEAVPLNGPEAPAVVGLRRGEVHLCAVASESADVRWCLDFDDEATATGARDAVASLLARIARNHEAAGIHYTGDWSLDNDRARATGRYRATVTDGWATTIARLSENRAADVAATVST